MTKPIFRRKVAKLPKIKNSRFGNNMDAFSADFKRRYKNLSMVKKNKNLKLPSHLSNFSIFATPGKGSGLEITREKENKSMNQLVYGAKDKRKVGPSFLPAFTNLLPSKQTESKKTLPVSSGLNMMLKNDSTVILPKGLISQRMYEKYVIFCDIEVYLK